MRLISFFTTYNVHLVYTLQECMAYGMSIGKSVDIKKSVIPNLFCVTGQRLCHRVRVAPICVNELGHYLFIKCLVSFSVSYYYLIKIQQLSCRRKISKIPSAKWRLFLCRPQWESTRLCPSIVNGSLFMQIEQYQLQRDMLRTFRVVKQYNKCNQGKKFCSNINIIRTYLNQ